jgi:hypothetical protein
LKELPINSLERKKVGIFLQEIFSLNFDIVELEETNSSRELNGILTEALD